MNLIRSEIELFYSFFYKISMNLRLSLVGLFIRFLRNLLWT